MKTATLLTASLLLGLSTAQPAVAELKIATVEMTRIMNEADMAKTKRKEIDKLIEAASEKREDKQKDLSQLQDKLKGSNDQKDFDTFDKKRKELERDIQDANESINRKIQETSKALSGKAIALIKAYAKGHAIGLVLDKSERMKSPVLFSEATDITDEIIKQMND